MEIKFELTVETDSNNPVYLEGVADEIKSILNEEFDIPILRVAPQEFYQTSFREEDLPGYGQTGYKP